MLLTFFAENTFFLESIDNFLGGNVGLDSFYYQALQALAAF